jgi:hypothetical protein
LDEYFIPALLDGRFAPMSRSTVTTIALIFVGAFAAAVVPLNRFGRSPDSVAAAADAKPAPAKHIVDPVLEKDAELLVELAKEREAALRADPKKLARDKIKPARAIVEATFRLYLAEGQNVPIDVVLRSASRLVETELAVAETDDERVAALERMWKIAYAVERVNKVRHDAGRIPEQELAESTWIRLDSQQRWLEARAAKEKKNKK